MKSIIILLVITLFTSRTINADKAKCTKSGISMAEFALDVLKKMNNNEKLDLLELFKAAVHNGVDIAINCADKKIDINIVDKCLNDLAKLKPSFEELSEDIKNKDYDELFALVPSILLKMKKIYEKCNPKSIEYILN